VKYFAAQVKTGGEEKFIRLFKSAHPDTDFPIYFLQRELRERHKGSVISKKQPLFPGYIFVRLEEDGQTGRNQRLLRKTEGFGRFLRSNQDISPLGGKDLEIVQHFIGNGGAVAGISKVYFNSEDRIVVCDGPLSGQEGRIVKVDKRKGRAKIRLDLYDETFLVDLAFEVISPAKTIPSPIS